MAEINPWSTPARRAIGAQLIDAPKPAYQIAAELGADPSNTARSLRRLRDDHGAVKSSDGHDGQPVFELAFAQEEALLSAIAGEQPRGMLVAGQHALLVPIRDDQEGTFAAVLRNGARTGQVVWTARMDGAAQYLVVFDRDADVFAALRLAEALAAGGIAARRVSVESVLGPEELRRKTASLRLERRRE